MKSFHRVTFFLGSVLLAVLLWRIGPGALARHLALLGWSWVILLSLEGLAECCHVEGWRRCLVGETRSLPWTRIAMIRQAGAAYNYLTPTANMGGEVIKATLLSREGNAVEAATSVLVGKLALVMTQLLWMACGSAVVICITTLPLPLKWSWAITTVFLAAGITAFAWLQRAGKLLSFVERIPGVNRIDRWMGGKWIEGLKKVDFQLMQFHRRHKRDLFTAMAWHLLGFIINGVESCVFLLSLNVRDAVGMGMAVWFLGAWFDLIGFVVPSGMGIQEGSRVLIFGALHLTGGLGLAWGVTLRIVRSFWSAVGLLGYGFVLRRGKGPKTEADSLTC